MNVCAVVSEFNPFHNGHKYLMSKLREKNVSHVVAVMSGNFTQRGDVAVVSKMARTKMALLGGVDLVVELPVCFSLSPAERFARAALWLIKSIGCVNTLGFGCECENARELINISKRMNLKFDEKVKEFLKNGVTFSKARQRAIEHLYGTNATNIILKPNNILAIEYIKALNYFNMKLNIEPIVRMTVQHNDMFDVAGFASSSFIREKIYNKESILDYMPKESYSIFINEIKNFRAPCFIENGERAVLSILRTLTTDDILNIQDISEGLENRVYNSIRDAKSVDELYFLIKTKRYTLARIRRIVLSSFLGLSREIQECLPPYIRVLGFNEKGSEILKKMKNTAKLPVILKYNNVLKSNNDEIINFFNVESKASDLYSFFMPNILKCGQEMLSSPVILKK